MLLTLKGIPMRQTSAKYCSLFYKETAFRIWRIAFFSFLEGTEECTSAIYIDLYFFCLFLWWLFICFLVKAKIVGIFEKIRGCNKYSYDVTQDNDFEFKVLHTGLRSLMTSLHH